MTPMPTWWLAISAFAYVMLALVCIALIGACVYLVIFLKNVLPKIVAIEGQVKEITGKIQELTASIKDTVDNVGGKAKGVVGSAEGVVQSASRQFERYSPFVIGSLTAIRLVSALSKARQGTGLAKATSKKGFLPKRKPKTLLGKVIAFVRR